MQNPQLIPSHSLFSKINTYSFIFSLIVIIFLGIMRFSTLYILGDSAEIQNNLSVLDELFIVGLKFDLRVIGITLLLLVYLPYMLLFWLKNSSLFLKWIKLSLSFSLLCIVLLAFVDIGYFLFFGTPIDILIFGLLEDDTLAVIESGITDPYLLLIGFIAPLTAIVLVWIFLKVGKALVSKSPLILIPEKSVWLVLLLPLLLLAARGSAGTFPLTLKQSSICSNSFINSLTQNAVFHLKYAYGNRKENNLNKSTSKILVEAKVKDIDELMQKSGFDASQPLLHKTPINPLLEKKPPHVIFVQMEGWSSHIALTDAPDNPVLGSFRKHAQQDYFLPYFFSNQNGTNPTIESILLNSPLTPLSQSSGYKTSFSMSNIRPFKEKGYDTLFLSGGYSSWRNHDVFWPKQGFNAYIGRTVIEDKFQVTAADNPWGVYDEYLFKYLQDDLPKRDKPAFFFVLTTNNHPPVRLPVDYHPPDFNVKSMGFKDNLAYKKTLLSGFHYQTNALGDFLDWLKNSPLKDDVIVVATGDHPLRGFDDYGSLERQYLRFSVPAYFYIPDKYNLLKSRSKDMINALYGSHVDLFPTLFELALSDASYFAFGSPIMKKASDNAYGWNYKDTVLLKEGVIDSKTKMLYAWSKQNKTLLNPNGKAVSEEQSKILKQEKYRQWLKEWLLYQDKDKESN